MKNEDTGALLSFVNQVTGDKAVRVEDDLGHGFVRLQVTEAERRQARHDVRSVEDCVIELLRNARDAGAKRLFVATSKNADGIRQVTVVDDGQGIPTDMHATVFEPRVTSKLDGVTEDRWGIHGRGMALYAISVVCESSAVQASEPGLGSSLRVVIDTSKLNERKDQSTFPKAQEEDGRVILKGVKNLPWVATRMSMDHPGLEVFLGSPAEIVAAMIAAGRNVNAGHLQPNPLWLEVAHAANVAELERVVTQVLGESLSVRTLQRIMSGESGSAELVSEKASPAPKAATPEAQPKISVAPDENLSKRFSSEDLRAFAQEIEESFRNLGNRYFIKPGGIPEVSRRKRSLNIVIDLIEDDTES